MKKSKKKTGQTKPSPPLTDSLLLSALMENVADSIYFKDRQRRLIWVSNKLVKDLGHRDPAKILGKTDEELFGEDFGNTTMVDDLTVMETGKPIIGMVESRKMPDGSLNWTSTSKLPIHDEKGKIVGLLGITREINELKQVEQDLQYLATHDSLTTLPNRFLLFDAIDQAIKRAARNKKHLAILYIDIDGFKNVNDHFGHDEGDRLLKQFALRLAKSIRDTDRAARLGGDEFAVLLEDLDSSQEALLVAEKIRVAICEPYSHLPRKAAITASIGVSMYPGRAKTASALVSSADHAMYQAKRKKNRVRAFRIPSIHVKRSQGGFVGESSIYVLIHILDECPDMSGHMSMGKS